MFHVRVLNPFRVAEEKSAQTLTRSGLRAISRRLLCLPQHASLIRIQGLRPAQARPSFPFGRASENSPTRKLANTAQYFRAPARYRNTSFLVGDGLPISIRSSALAGCLSPLRLVEILQSRPISNRHLASCLAGNAALFLLSYDEQANTSPR